MKTNLHISTERLLYQAHLMAFWQHFNSRNSHDYLNQLDFIKY